MNHQAVADLCRVLNDLRLNTPQVKGALQDLETIYQLSANARADNVGLIIGRARTGKSTAVKMFKDKHPPYRDPVTGYLQQPVLVVVVPENCTTKALACAVLEKLGVPIPRGTQLELVTLMKVHLLKQAVKVLVLDELQHMVEGRSKIRRFAQGTTDWIKVLTTEGICSVVGVGVETMHIFAEQHEQFEARMNPYIEMVGLHLDDPADRQLALALLLKTQQALAPIVQMDLCEGDFPSRMIIASQGLIGKIIKLIQDASMVALGAERTNVEVSDFAAAWRKSRSRKGSKKNPFAPDNSLAFLMDA